MFSLTKNEQKDFIGDWLSCIDDKNHYASVQKIFLDDSFNLITLQKEVLKILFEANRNKNPFDLFVILGDGSNVKVIPNDSFKFSEMLDSGAIKVAKDYFRIAQDYPIG